MSTQRQIDRIVKRDGSVVPYDRGRIVSAIQRAATSVGNTNLKLANSMVERVEAALLSTYGADAMPTVEDIQDVVESVLMEDRLTHIARSYIIYRHQHAMARAARAYTFEVTDNVPYRVIYEVLRWNMEHGCESIPSLNRIIARRRYPQLVADSDRRYEREIETVAQRILDNRSRIRIVIIAGPSSSGKTTATIKISEHLRSAGIGFKAINIDNYFFDLCRHPRDEFGDYDYETPQALDLELINRHLLELLDGRTMKTPSYDFKTGVRTMDTHELKLKASEILLIDSLHGLYDPMTASVPAEAKFKVYIETLGQFRAEDGTFMRWADNRLLRRMVRDNAHRNLKPMGTLAHWHYVRKSELKNIIPYIRHADAIVNSALPYELPILKHRLFRYFPKAVAAYRNDPKRLDAHIRASRVYELLKPLRGIRDDSCVPSSSLLREFIGGSKYEY